MCGRKQHERQYLNDSIEEDFITWKDKLWTSVCEFFSIESTGEDISLRQYELTVHDDMEIMKEKVYVGEPARLGSFKNQRP